MSSELVAQYLRKPYARVIIPDDLGWYAAQVLEFPGCFAEGDTPEKAYENLEGAAESWVGSALSQGMSIPEPFASQGYSGTVSLRLPKSIHRRASEYARRDGVSLNQFLLSAIAARVGAEELLRTLVAKLDDRIDRLHYIDWVPVEGMLRRIPAATTRGRAISPDVPLSERMESAALPRTRELLPAMEVHHG